MKFALTFLFSISACAIALPTQNEPIAPTYDAMRDVRFLLQNRQNRGNAVQVTLGDLNSINQSVYRRDLPMRISIHGWGANADDGTHHSIARVLLDEDDFNFVFIDWSAGAQTINYVAARNNVPPTGAAVAAFLDWLHENDLLDFNQVTIIGFSLGAHVAGFTGKSVTRGRVNTIIGLDPAGPLFPVGDPTGRLDVGDAVYVEAIHTNGGTLGSGIGAPIAHADFFPNGGETQPGCTTGGCSHTRAVSLYMESVTNNQFRANRCATAADAATGNCALTPIAFMGGEPSNYRNNLRGIFHMTTNSASPFGRG
ncbi:CLUMA_CG001267, isoform A [Clunio marinus]|uniref:CLUMA_CG001267, isoform A n=1 Tax=Clunio marinus TaxID=568069 RepID=A0A1J1HIT2_9DIPT|nr:CLUMA_CG001267, isoform A [Clunio marinus]